MNQASARPFDLAHLRVGAILNTSSGSCDADCAAKITEILGRAAITPTVVEAVPGDKINATLERMLADDTDVLIVLGGDGTIRAAAEQCVQSNTKLIPLPGGTMNMLPRALYGEGTWDKTLAHILSSPVLRVVGGGEVDGHRFFCAGIFGSPALWADAREAIRKRSWLDILDKALSAYQHTFSRKIRYRLDAGDFGSTVAVSTICPLISASLESDARAFEIAILDPGDVRDAAYLAWNAVFSDWRNDRNVTAVRADKIEIKASGNIPAILDGEKIILPRMAEIRYLRNCFTAVVVGLGANSAGPRDKAL